MGLRLPVAAVAGRGNLSESGERTRLACNRQSGSDRWRPRHRGLFPPQSVAARRRNWRAGSCAPSKENSTEMMRLGYLKTGEMVKTLRFDGERRVSPHGSEPRDNFSN